MDQVNTASMNANTAAKATQATEDAETPFIQTRATMDCQLELARARAELEVRPFRRNNEALIAGLRINDSLADARGFTGLSIVCAGIGITVQRPEVGSALLAIGGLTLILSVIAFVRTAASERRLDHDLERFDAETERLRNQVTVLEAELELLFEQEEAARRANAETMWDVRARRMVENVRAVRAALSELGHPMSDEEFLSSLVPPGYLKLAFFGAALHAGLETSREYERFRDTVRGEINTRTCQALEKLAADSAVLELSAAELDRRILSIVSPDQIVDSLYDSLCYCGSLAQEIVTTGRIAMLEDSNADAGPVLAEAP